MDRGNRGVFWLIDGKIFAVPYDDGASFGISKSGDNYNHRLLWDYVKSKGCNKPYDYYPRGRGEQSNKGKPLLSDIPDYEYVEMLADKLILLHRDEVFDKESEKKGLAELVIYDLANWEVQGLSVGLSSR